MVKISTINAQNPWWRQGVEFAHYEKNGKEIDAIFRGDERYLCIEIKYQNQVNERDIRRIAPLNRYFILSKEDVERKENLMILPVDIFLALLPVSEMNV